MIYALFCFEKRLTDHFPKALLTEMCSEVVANPELSQYSNRLLPSSNQGWEENIWPLSLNPHSCPGVQCVQMIMKYTCNHTLLVIK